jgi:LacI family transcriptional regulator
MPKGVVAAAERLTGIRELLDAADVQLAGGVVVSDWQPKAGYEATCELLKRKIEVKALICFNDRLRPRGHGSIRVTFWVRLRNDR